MALLEVYTGRRSWEEYLGNRQLIEGLEQCLQDRPVAATMQVGLSQSDYQIALESGLGALDGPMGGLAGEELYSLEFSYEKLGGGLDQLNADFNLLMGDIIWKIEMHEERLNSILQEIRLAEFEREARAYRNRAERAYLNGWYEEALNDFLDAEKRNYPDFAVHRSIANICLYHRIDLPRALEYFCKAAKYSRPSDKRQSAESHYFAGVICAARQQHAEALSHLGEAVRLNPEFYEAHYQKACLAAIAGDGPTAVASLEPAIKGDPRYYERAKNDAVFSGVRPAVQALLDHLMEPLQEKVAQVKQDAELLKGYIFTQSDKQQRIAAIFQNIEQQTAAANSYRASLRFIESLSQIQSELRDIFDQFNKQYEIDPHDYVRSVAFSPDGRLLATGFLNAGIEVWEVDTGLKALTLKGHLASVNSVAFSPDCMRLASGSRDKTIKLWDPDTGREIRTLSGHTGEVRAVTFSPNGVWLASASHDHTVRLWRTVTGREAQALNGHTHFVTSAVFSPDGSLLASGSLDKTIKVWEVATGRQIRSLAGHTKGIEALAFSPDGRCIASGGIDRLVMLWEVATGRQLQTLSGHRNDVTSIAFSPDGGLIAAGSLGKTIMVWKLDTGQVLRTLRHREISYNSVAFSPKGQWLALASRDLQLWVKALLTEEEYAEVKAGKERALQAREQVGLTEGDGKGRPLPASRFAPAEQLALDRYGRDQCEVCGAKLRFYSRWWGRERCKIHRQDA